MCSSLGAFYFIYELCYLCSTTQIKVCPHDVLTLECVLYVVTNCWFMKMKKESWRIHISSLVIMCILNIDGLSVVKLGRSLSQLVLCK
jgi:hypothetical protein